MEADDHSISSQG